MSDRSSSFRNRSHSDEVAAILGRADDGGGEDDEGRCYGTRGQLQIENLAPPSRTRASPPIKNHNSFFNSFYSDFGQSKISKKTSTQMDGRLNVLSSPNTTCPVILVRYVSSEMAMGTVPITISEETYRTSPKPRVPRNMLPVANFVPSGCHSS